MSDCYAFSCFQDSVPVQSEPSLSTDTNDLLTALQVKAAAFSDESWNTHWQANGPKILIDAWKQAHPDMPLSRVARVCSVGFITPFLTESEASVHDSPLSDDDTDSLLLQKQTSADNEDCTVMDTNTEPVATADGNKMVNGLEKLQLSEINATQEIDESSVVESSCLNTEPPCGDVMSNDDLVTLWGDHYNSCYWYCFQSYSQEQLLLSAREEVSNRDRFTFNLWNVLALQKASINSLGKPHWGTKVLAATPTLLCPLYY